MTIQEAITKGFLNLTEKEVQSVLDQLFDIDDPEQRLNDGLDLMLTFLPEERISHVLDLSDIVLDAHEDTQAMDGEDLDEDGGHPHDHDHDHHHDHDHNHDEHSHRD